MRSTPAVLVTFCLAVQMLSHAASAMPEALFNSRADGAIPKMIAGGATLAAVQAKFSLTLVPVLDQLWDTRQDFVNGSCKAPSNNCRRISVFHGSSGDRPIVLMPGFTGYRKMYLEQIYDLLQAGYGPVYISDFAGTGDSYKPYLGAGQPEQTLNQRLAKDSGAIPDFKSEVAKGAGAANGAIVSKVLGQLPVGIGYIPSFDDYQKDTDVVMNEAVRENPNRKIIVTSLSMSGLTLAIALANQAKRPTWISHVDRIVLESPMLRALASNLAGDGFGAAPEAFAGVWGFFTPQKILKPTKAYPEFANKALGRFNPINSISHSANRLSLTDSLRVWNGHETAGATLGWSYQELSNQYSVGPFDSQLFSAHPLNDRVSDIATSLKRNHIALVVASSLADQLVDTGATKMFLTDLVKEGVTDIHFCTFATSGHVMDQESDRYREPYMALVLDQKSQTVRSSYGVAPRNELLQCHQLGRH